MARVEREREKKKQKQQQEQERRRVEAEEMARRRRIEAPPPTTTTVEHPRAEEPPEPLQRRLSSTSTQHAAPARRSSLRQTPAPQPDAQPLERSNTLSSSSTTHSDAPTARPRAASMRAPSRVSIIEPPAPIRAPSVRSTGGPGMQSTSQRNSSFTALTSLDSLGLGTPRGMPVSALMPQMPPAPPMQPQPPIGWSYPEAQPEPERERVHVPMPPPPPTVMQARTAHSRAPDNINVAVAQEDRNTGNRTTTPTSSITSSVSTSLRNLRLTSFPVSGTGAGRDRERNRELSVILEHHAEGSVSPSGNGNGNGSVASAWASPYADPSSVEMDAWRRGSGSRTGSGVDTPRPMPAAGMPVAREETPVIPPQLQQAQQQWQQPSGTATPVPMLSPYGSGTYVQPQGQVPSQGPLSQDSLRRSSSASTSTVNITVVPPSRPASTGLGQTAAQTDPAHGGHRRRPGLLSADSIDSESESDSDDDDDSPGPVHPRVLNPLPAFAQGVVMPPPGSVRGGGGAGGGAFPSGFVPIGGGLPPGAVTGGIGLGGNGTAGGFVTESAARPLSRGPPLLGVTPPNNHSGFTVEPARRQPASTSTTPVPTTRMGGGPPSMFSNTTITDRPLSRQSMGSGMGVVPPAVASSWSNNEPACDAARV
ncbi:hypothetical protein C8F01DRAFT_562703 [Mycena amicta]|nr:hypothetical protein C8F01DRAFT_562703 [Mycena amicta]